MSYYGQPKKYELLACRWCLISNPAVMQKKDVSGAAEDEDGVIDYYWTVMCRSCGHRVGYKRNFMDAVKIWNAAVHVKDAAPMLKHLSKETPKISKDHSNAALFEEMNKMGVEWREWSKKMEVMFMATTKSMDQRLLTLEQAVTIPAYPYKRSEGDKRRIRIHKFSRCGFKFEITANLDTKATSGKIVRCPVEHGFNLYDLQDRTAETIMQDGDVYDEKRGVQIVLRKLVALIKNIVMDWAHRRVQRMHNVLRDLKWQIK